MRGKCHGSGGGGGRGVECVWRATEVTDVLAGENLEHPRHVSHRQERVKVAVIRDERPVYVGTGQIAQRIADKAAPSVDARALAERLYPGSLSEATRTAIARAESPAEGLALFLVSPEFVRR